MAEAKQLSNGIYCLYWKPSDTTTRWLRKTVATHKCCRQTEAIQALPKQSRPGGLKKIADNPMSKILGHEL